MSDVTPPTPSPAVSLKFQVSYDPGTQLGVYIFGIPALFRKLGYAAEDIVAEDVELAGFQLLCLDRMRALRVLRRLKRIIDLELGSNKGGHAAARTASSAPRKSQKRRGR